MGSGGNNYKLHQNSDIELITLSTQSVGAQSLHCDVTVNHTVGTSTKRDQRKLGPASRWSFRSSETNQKTNQRTKL